MLFVSEAKRLRQACSDVSGAWGTDAYKSDICIHWSYPLGIRGINYVALAIDMDVTTSDDRGGGAFEGLSKSEKQQKYILIKSSLDEKQPKLTYMADFNYFGVFQKKDPILKKKQKFG